MNLKKIELHGFKSFADRTEIVFNSNITGIVGPNGCGKSNVIDAVRWVLGEMAPTSLRVGKMAELIFNGTEQRRSMSYCEVSLYLDNSDHKYDVAFDEVVVTRRLDRSGKSEYFINRQECLKNNIVNLFRDTGIGKDGYSIIGQGKIDAILASSPEARRKIFEEAAGIAAQKEQRTRTEAKLQTARLNMSRIFDILKEIGDRLEPLRKEAEAAAKAKALKEELKFFEIRQYLYQCENSETERKAMEDKLAKTAEELARCSADFNRVSGEYNAAMAEIESGDARQRELNEKLTNSLVEAERAAGDGRAIGERIEQAKRRDGEIKNQRLQNSALLDDKAQRITQKIEESEQAKANLNKLNAELDSLDKKNAELNAKILGEEREMETLREMYIENVTKNAEIDKDAAQLALRKQILEKDLGSAKDEYDRRRRLSDESESALNALNDKLSAVIAERDKAVSDSREGESNLAAAQKELAEAEQKKSNTAAEIKNVEYSIASVESLISNYYDYEDSVQNLMKAAAEDGQIKRKIVGTVAEILNVPKDLRTAIGIALGKSWQNIVTQNEYDAAELMQLLRERRLGRATFLPMTTMKYNDLPREYSKVRDEAGVVGVASELVDYDSRYANIVSNLLGKTVVVEDQETGLAISKKYGYAFRVVTLEGDMFQTSGALTGGSVSKNKSGVFSREAELKNFKARRDKLKKDFVLLGEVIADLKEEVAKQTSALSFLKARVNKLEVEIASVNGEILKVKGEIDFHRGEMEKLFSGNEDKLKELQQIEVALKATEANKKGADSEKVNANTYIDELKAIHTGDKEKAAALSAALADKRVEITAATAEAERCDREIIALKTECRNIEDAIRSLDVEEKINASELLRLTAELERTKFSDEDQAKIDDLRAALKAVDEKKKKLNQRVKELDAERQSLSDLAARIRERGAKEESKLTLISTSLDNAAVRIVENYGYDFDMSKEYIDGLDDSVKEQYSFEPSKAASHINGLRGRIERIGPINELAESAYNDERVRYDELQEQYSDLEKGEKDMVALIKDLTEEMTEKFTVSFNQINRNFNEVFAELFGGGRAKMELEPGVDVLEAGIEIMAEPPGKKLTNLAPLSGGERAMTAIAILFAIIKLNPMPFSILDEIEAALDDANARVFAQYLKKFSQFTQFIVVTHRKPTMSLCDTLFGITMQEMGVSKTVQVKLEEAVKYEEIEKERLKQEKAAKAE